MNDTTEVFFNPEDGFSYFYDKSKKCYAKRRDVGTFAQLPDAVKHKVKSAKRHVKTALFGFN